MATTVSLPLGSVVTDSVAVPEPFKVPFPKLVVPKVNVTDPVGADPPLDVTTAVNFTVAPDLDGLGDELNASVVVA